MSVVAPSSLFDLDFPRAFPGIAASADFRTRPEDFFVDEVLGFDFSGMGEHICLHIEKIGQNTVWVAKQLAELAGIKQMDIGYCGLKDRHAVTRQWFSLCSVKRELDWQSIHLEGCKVLAVNKHDKKLRRGMHAGNAFRIHLRNVNGDSGLLEQRWEDIVRWGVPNYFGEQRFGYDGGNLQQAHLLLPLHARLWREHKNQFAVSAIRSYLFNLVLADRIRTVEWHDVIDGDPQPFSTGPLWGRGRPLALAALAEREQSLLQPYAAFCEKLEHLGLQQERRALLLQLADASARYDEQGWVLNFSLPPGTYATSVLREVLALNNLQQRSS
ncbi:MAG TPA: tRNA pseudouridine(13) synthase TruD [Pseudomonadales bacterium]|nr:tRNA pseudouridine(13) synthase TruD [Pseudomonadales bacterium]